MLAGCLSLSPCLQGAETPASRSSGETVSTTLLPIPAKLVKDIPPARNRKEVDALLPKILPKPSRELRIVLIAGPKDHGPGEHDYPAWQRAWHKLLGQTSKTRVSTSWEKPTEEDFKAADVLVFFQHGAWERSLNQAMEGFLARGGGVVLLHYAVKFDKNPDGGQLLGLYSGSSIKYRHGQLDVTFEDRKDDLLRGLAGRRVRFRDESYWRLTGSTDQIELLATCAEEEEEGKELAVPMIWNRQIGKGRIHVNILGHYNWTFNDPVARIIFLRGIAWAAGEPVDRFASLATIDVDMSAASAPAR